MDSKLNFKAAFKHLPTGASLMVIFAGCLVLLGWFLNLPSLQTILPGLPKMTFNTALTMILAGLSLLMLSRTPRPETTDSRAQWSAVIPAVLVTLIGLLTLSQYLFGWNLGIDQLLFQDQAGELESAIPGRPSPHTSATFVLTGLALLLFYYNTPRRNWLAQFLSLTAAFIPLLALVGYAYDATIFFRISTYTGMALHTALSFIILCTGLLFLRPAHGLMALMTAPFLGSILARRLLLAAIGIPLVIGWLSLIGEQAGLYSSELEPVLLTVASAYALSAAIWWYAHSLTNADARRKQAEEQFRLVVEASPNAIILVNTAGKINLANEWAESLFGYTRKELIGQPIEMLIPHQFRTHHIDYRTAFLDDPTARPMGAGRDLFGLRKDGSEVPVEIGLNPITMVDGDFVLASIIDITERKRAEAEIADLLQREQAARIETKKLNEELEQRVLERTAALEVSNKELEAFSYSVSHDLRAPLRSIDGFSQALIEDYGSDLNDTARDYLQRVRAGSQQMAALIDDLLTLSRLSRTEMRRDTINLSELAQEIADTLRRQEPERKVKFIIKPDLVVRADRQLMWSMLENLLGNAWKFTGKRSAAQIEFGALSEPDGQTVYYVRDNGAGFDMAYATKLFGAFQRLHSTAEFPGTGIGLASVQRVIHRHGGQIWAEGAVDEGATFYFTIEQDKSSP